MEATPKDSYTILRIKRKRAEEPLEALVVDDVKRRRSKGAFGSSQERRKEGENACDIFQFAETVEGDIWDHEEMLKAMKDRIISRQTIPLKRGAPLASPASPPRKLPHSTSIASPRKYTIVPRTAESGKSSPAAPPIVRSAKSLQKETEDALKLSEELKLYEAVPIDYKSEVSLEDDPEMASFIPMLKDYLRVNDIDIRDPVNDDTAKLPNPEDNIDDYVWDVFIHRTLTLDEWNSVALLGSVTGVPRDDDYPSDESEVEDEADEDSNDENWYGNDYPDEGESDQDIAEDQIRPFNSTATGRWQG